MAIELEADVLMILTDVPTIYLDYGTARQRGLATVTCAEMESYAAAGHFKAGSMGPKVEAALRFARHGGIAVVAALLDALPALAGTAGTRITPSQSTPSPGEHSG